MSKIAFLLIGLCLVLSQAAYTLPDLCVDLTAPNCYNFETVAVNIAGSKQRLTQLSSRLADDIKLVSDSKSNAQSFCDSLQKGSSSFVETKHKVSNTMKKHKKIKTNVLAQWYVESPATDCAVDKELAESVPQIYSRAIQLRKYQSWSDKANDACSNLISDATQLNDYLVWLKAQVDSILNTQIPSIENSIKNLKTSCVLTLVGLDSRDLESTDLAKEKSSARTVKYTINFSKTFASVPQVGVAVVGMHIQNKGSAVKVWATDIKKTGFTLNIQAYANIKVYSVQTSWIATDSALSGIEILTNSPSTKTLSPLCVGDKSRSIVEKVNLPSGKDYSSYSVVPVISGFYIESGYNPRIRVSSSIKDSTIETQYSTWLWGCIIEAHTNLILFDKKYSQSTSTSFISDDKGMAELTLFKKERSVSTTRKIGDFKDKPLIFLGLSGFEFTNLNNYRLKVVSYDTTGSYSRTLSVKFATWDYSRVYVAEHNFLATCSNFACWNS